MEGRGGQTPDPGSTPGSASLDDIIKAVRANGSKAKGAEAKLAPTVVKEPTTPPKSAPQFDYNAADPLYAPVDVLKTTREGGQQMGRAATGAVQAIKAGDPKLAANAAADGIEG